MAMNNGLRSCASKFLSSTQSFLPKSALISSEPAEAFVATFCTKTNIREQVEPEWVLVWPPCKVPKLYFTQKLLYFKQRILLGNVNRGIHSTGVKKMGGGHGHDEPFYLHAKHMYNLDRMKHQQLKMTLGVLSAFTIGVAVPVYAVIFQQKKTSSA